MTIDHIGVAVRSIEAALESWKTLFGYHQMTEVVTNTRQGVRVVFLSKPNSITVKLVEGTDPTSPVSRFAQRGGSLHHLCFKCDSVEDEKSRLMSLGCRTLSEAEPGEAFDNEKIAFVYAGGVNVELIDTDRRARRLPVDPPGAVR